MLAPRLFAIALGFLSAVSVAAEITPEQLALAKESEAYCQETEKDAAALTPKLIVEKVSKVCEILAKEGAAGFSKCQGKGSEFIFCGTYMSIYNSSGTILMQPLKPQLNGKQMMGLKDDKGKAFFAEMMKVANDAGSGWVEYRWPKPGVKEYSPKVAYVKLVKHGEEEFVVACGLYDMTKEEIVKQLGTDK